MGSEPQRGQSFQSLGATGLTGLNLWILKLHIRADETLNLSDGGRVEGLGECVSKSQSQAALMDLLVITGMNVWEINPVRHI